jgi:GNAT superfamily N-acetyltransferase
MIGAPEIEVRLANQRDIDAVSALLEAQLSEHQMTPPAEALRASIRTVIDGPRYGFILLAAGPDNVAVGVAYASSLLSFEHGGVSGWVEELYVTPARRGQGIGSRLLERVISIAKEFGWRALDLEVDTNHERSIALYRRHHFLPHSRSRFYLALTEDFLPEGNEGNEGRVY